MHKSEGKAVAFHLKKPSIESIRVSFLYESIDDEEEFIAVFSLFKIFYIKK